MRTLNRQRANIVISYLSETGKILDPGEVAYREHIFERNGVLRWRQSQTLGYGLIGVKIEHVLRLISEQDRVSGAWKSIHADLCEWRQCFENSKHLLWFDRRTQTALVVLKRNATPQAQLKAWAHGLLMAKKTNEQSDRKSVLAQLRESLDVVETLFDTHTPGLEAAGWDLTTSALETRSGARVEINLPQRR